MVRFCCMLDYVFVIVTCREVYFRINIVVRLNTVYRSSAVNILQCIPKITRHSNIDTKQHMHAQDKGETTTKRIQGMNAKITRSQQTEDSPQMRKKKMHTRAYRNNKKSHSFHCEQTRITTVGRHIEQTRHLGLTNKQLLIALGTNKNPLLSHRSDTI